MRVSYQQIYAALSNQVSSRWESLTRIQQQVSSGQQISKPSDDPSRAERISMIQSSMSRIEDCQRAATTAQNLLEASEASLGEASDLLIRAKSLAVQNASEQYDADARAQSALEVRAMFEELLSLANADVGGRYLFGGFANATPPFQSDGSYAGDSNIPQVEVAPELIMDMAVRGDLILAGSGGGVDLFACLDDLATALESDNSLGIQNALDEIDTGLEQLSTGRAQCGALLQSIQMANSFNDRMELGLEQDRTRLQDTDLSRASMDLALAQQALEATLASTPGLMAQNILDYM